MGQHPGLAPALPVAPAGPPIALAGEVPQWHVSINDVPVGPVRLEELGHKIDAGAVSEYSLVWRDGLDEWRPLATVPELMALLHERRHSGPPSRTSFSSMPAFVDSRTSIAKSSEPTRSSSPVVEFETSVMPDDFVPLADSLAPEGERSGALRDVSQPPAPIGPPGIFDSSEQFGSFSGLPAVAGEGVSVPSVPPAAAAASAEPRRGLSLGVLALIFAVVVLAGVSAFLTYERFGDSVLNDWLGNGAPVPVDSRSSAKKSGASTEETASNLGAGAADAHVAGAAADAEPGNETDPAEAAPADPAEAAPADPVEAAPAEPAKATRAEPARVRPAKSAQAELVFDPPNPANDGPTMAPATKPRPKARRKARAQVVPKASDEGSLSSEEQRILDEFGSGADADPAKIAVKKSGTSQSDKPPLDGHAVRATVTTNKPRLQRCYERAIRGQQSPPSVRLDVTVTVAASGRVKNVTADGSGPGGLAECIEASVRRWRFPASSEGGPAQFPIVFSSN